MTQPEKKVIIRNRQAQWLYRIESRIEAGVVLEGWEVKALLAGRGQLCASSAHVRIEQGQAFLYGLTLDPLPGSGQGQIDKFETARPRKLLLTRQELDRLAARIKERGYTLVPVAITKVRKIKVDLGLAKGKNLRDKRETIKARDLARAGT